MRKQSEIIGRNKLERQSTKNSVAQEESLTTNKTRKN